MQIPDDANQAFTTPETPRCSHVPALAGSGIREGRRSPWPHEVAWSLINAIQALCLALCTASMITAGMVMRLLDFRQETLLTIAQRVWAPVVLRGAFARLEVGGGQDVDWRKPCILMANHQSLMDIPAIMAAVPVPLRFIAKRSLLRVPFLGWYLSQVGMTCLDCHEPRLPVDDLRRATSSVRSGSHLLVFPEGTRTRTGRLLPFRPGLFSVAFQAQVPIVPLTIRGASSVLPAGGFRVRPGTIRITIGSPLAVATESRQAKDRTLQRVREVIENGLR